MIPILLADAAPETIKTWLECLAWLVGFVAGVVGIYSMLKKPEAAPQPFVVEAHKQYATQSELTQLALKMDEELGRERGSRKKIHEQISRMQSDLTGLTTETSNQNTSLSELKTDVQEVSTIAAETGGKVDLMNQQLQQLTNHLLRKNS